MGPDFIQLSGEDMTALAFNAAGGQGCISVVSNVAPALCSQLQEATLAGDYRQALDIQDRLVPLHAATFLEPGLAGAKCGLNLLGRGNEEVRSPLLPVTDVARAAIRKAMVHAGLLN
jgi:4-hydroxy-tetrahydrodipicolinate synthase